MCGVGLIFVWLEGQIHPESVVARMSEIARCDKMRVVIFCFLVT